MMVYRYAKYDSLMCLLLPKRLALLPWRGQPNVVFAYTFSNWQKFAEEHGKLSMMPYRGTDYTSPTALQYCFADACLSQFYEIAFSKEEATCVLALKERLSVDAIQQELATVVTPDMVQRTNAVLKQITEYLHLNASVTISKPLVSAACLLYNYENSKGAEDIWTRHR